MGTSQGPEGHLSGILAEKNHIFMYVKRTHPAFPVSKNYEIFYKKQGSPVYESSPAVSHYLPCLAFH